MNSKTNSHSSNSAAIDPFINSAPNPFHASAAHEAKLNDGVANDLFNDSEANDIKK